MQSPSKYSTTNSQTLNFLYQPPRHCLVIFISCPIIPPQEVHGLFICHDVVNLNFISFLKSLIVFYAKNYMIIKIMIVILKKDSYFLLIFVYTCLACLFLYYKTACGSVPQNNSFNKARSFCVFACSTQRTLRIFGELFIFNF